MNVLYPILFAILMLSYGLVIPRRSLDYWWAGINKINYLYYPFLISLVLVLLSFLYILYHTTFKETDIDSRYNIYWLVLMVASVIWSLVVFLGNRKLSIIPLSVVGIMGILMFWEVPKKWDVLTLATFYVAFHTFMMDFVIWGYFSLKN